jgi:hypothetical protein
MTHVFLLFSTLDSRVTVIGATTHVWSVGIMHVQSKCNEKPIL